MADALWSVAQQTTKLRGNAPCDKLLALGLDGMAPRLCSQAIETTPSTCVERPAAASFPIQPRFESHTVPEWLRISTACCA